MPTLIAPLIGTALETLLGIMKLARDAKELNRHQFDAIKKMIDKEFSEFPEWDEL